MMMTTLRSTVDFNGQITMKKVGGNQPTTADATENQDALAENRATVTDAIKGLTATVSEATQEFNGGRLDLATSLQAIQELALPQINAALGIPATSVGGAQDQGAGDPGLTQHMFSQLFADGQTGNDLLKNFAGLAATVTGKSLGDVGNVMNEAKGLFSGGQLNLANAAGFITKALGLNEKAIGLIATAYTLLSTPFTAAGAAALFQQAMALISESKEQNTQANTAQNTAQQQQQTGQQLAQVAQQRMQQTALMQAKIKEAMEKLKNNQVLTKEQIENLIKMKQQINNQPKGNGLTIPFKLGGCFEEPKTINMTVPSLVQPTTTPTVGFSPPPFQSITA